LHQVQYLGLLENVRVRRAGFAYRHQFRPFFFRYRILCEATYPTWSGSEKDGAAAICKQMDMKEGEDFQMGATKIFIRKPESVFTLEEKRDQRVSSFANRIQRFFTKFALQNWFYDLQVNGNRTLENHKERRRLSGAVRKFAGDYINFRDNYELKKLVGGREKVHFADMGNKYDRRGKTHRRVVLISNLAYYEISLELNPDKEQHAKKPFVYLIKRRAEWAQVRGVALSSLQDGFMLWQLPDYDTVLECRRKTELLANVKAKCFLLFVIFSSFLCRPFIRVST
jgi:myosin-1